MTKKVCVVVGFGVLSFLTMNCGSAEVDGPGDEGDTQEEPVATSEQALACTTSCRVNSAAPCPKGQVAYYCTTSCGYSYKTSCVAYRGSSYCTSTC